MSQTSHSEAELVELNRRINEEIWNEGNLDLVEELVAADYVEHNPTTPRPIRGPGGYAENVRRLRNAFPDLEHVQVDVFIEDDTLVERVTTRGTHEGSLMDIEPTGNAIEVQSINILRFEDERLAEMWIQPNTLGLMQQLGVVPDEGDAETDGGDGR